MLHRTQESMAESEILRRKGYNLMDTIGEGSYSKVKRATSSYIGRDVAIKIIAYDDAPKVFRDRFLPRELDILAQINHENVIKVHEIFQLGHPLKVFIVTELIHGGDLLDHVKVKGAVKEDLARWVFKDICHAVAYLHSKKIAHRDIKCENILLDMHLERYEKYGVSWFAKVCDFGFARKFTPMNNGLSEDTTQPYSCTSTTFCGSAAYASPEILERKPYDPMSADVWALGIVFFICLCGAMPYDDSNIRTMVRMQKRGETLLPQTRKTSRAARSLIFHALQPDPQLRDTVFKLLCHRWMTAEQQNVRKTGASVGGEGEQMDETSKQQR